MTNAPVLKIQNLHAGYGSAQILFGVNLEIWAGSCVSLLGRNGMGKTTIVRTIMGQLALKEGQIARFGDQHAGRTSFDIARSGIGLVPEGRHIFPNLSVRENLTAFWRPDKYADHTKWHFDSVLDLFPHLKDRLEHAGHHLSGGEQQMLAIGRALMTNPRLLILDEATEGLAPLICQQIWDCLENLKAAGQSILVIDKNIAALTRLADQHYILEKGVIVWHGNSRQLDKDSHVKSRYLGF